MYICVCLLHVYIGICVCGTCLYPWVAGVQQHGVINRNEAFDKDEFGRTACVCRFVKS